MFLSCNGLVISKMCRNSIDSTSVNNSVPTHAMFAVVLMWHYFQCQGCARTEMPVADGLFVKSGRIGAKYFIYASLLSSPYRVLIARRIWL